jgi:quercetin dioxygenase-like cupin family protein
VYDCGTGEKRLGPGSYLFEPAGLKHTAGAGEDADCVFFEEGSGAFNLRPAQ